MAKLFLSKEVNEKLNEEIAQMISSLMQEGITPTLVTLRVGEKADDIAYETSITKKFEKLGLAHKVIALPVETSSDEVISQIKKLNDDSNVHGILIFKPLPKHLETDDVINIIDPKKDVDGITNISMSKLYRGDKDAFAPCTAQAVIRILTHYGVELKGKNVVVVGRSLVIGKPVSLMLLAENATVTICHSMTKNLQEICKNADIIVAAVGKMQMLNKDFVSQNQIIIDVGIHVDEEGKMHGDVDFESVESLVSSITPVPGGVGGVTTGMLALATVKASLGKEK